MADENDKKPSAKKPGVVPEIPVRLRPVPRRVNGLPTITDKIDPQTGQKTTLHGKKIFAEMRGVIANVKKLPDHMKFLSVGRNFETGTTDRIIGLPRGDKNSQFSPTENKVTIPVDHKKFPGTIFGSEKVPHEAMHIADRQLAELYKIQNGKPADDFSFMTDFSQHPVFARAYASDLAKLPNNPYLKRGMDLEHYLPQKKGGEHSPEFNNANARSEVVAESTSIVLQGGESHKNRYWPHYTNDFKKLFSNTYKVTEKLHADLAGLAKKYPDQKKFDEAVGKYMASIPDDFRIYLAGSGRDKSPTASP